MTSQERKRFADNSNCTKKDELFGTARNIANAIVSFFCGFKVDFGGEGRRYYTNRLGMFYEFEYDDYEHHTVLLLHANVFKKGCPIEECVQSPMIVIDCEAFVEGAVYPDMIDLCKRAVRYIDQGKVAGRIGLCGAGTVAARLFLVDETHSLYAPQMASWSLHWTRMQEFFICPDTDRFRVLVGIVRELAMIISEDLLKLGYGEFDAFTTYKWPSRVPYKIVSAE